MNTTSSERHEPRIVDLVAAAFDAAEGLSHDPRVVSRLATRTVLRILRQVRRHRRPARRGAVDPLERWDSEGGRRQREQVARLLHQPADGSGAIPTGAAK